MHRKIKIFRDKQSWRKPTFYFDKIPQHFELRENTTWTLFIQSIYGIISLETKDKMYDDFVHILSTLNKLLVIFIIQIILIIICTKCP